MPVPPTCESCRFWDLREPHHTYGDCRRLPPRNTLSVYGTDLGGGRIKVEMTSHVAASWPNTASADWCGEHKARETRTGT